MSDAVFVFSGTGNSLQIAEEIAGRLSCGVTGIPLRSGKGPEVSGYDRIGFVFPVHYYKAPLPVEELISGMELRPDQSVWAVMDYGTTPGDAEAITFRLLESTGAKVLFSIGFRMPENYVMMFSVPEPEECERLCSLVPEHTDRVMELLESGETVRPGSTLGGRTVSLFGSPFYDIWRKTGKFRTNWRCTTCGLCAEICPAGVISMTEEGPVWTEPKCYHCAGCINRCPAEAIQYGRRTASRRRYVNPSLRNP